MSYGHKRLYNGQVKWTKVESQFGHVWTKSVKKEPDFRRNENEALGEDGIDRITPSQRGNRINTFELISRTVSQSVERNARTSA